MDHDKINEFAARLQQIKQELVEIASSAKESTMPVILDQASVGRLSRMDAMQAQQMAQESERRREGQLVRIEGAMRRIEAGTFGSCFKCGKDIDLRRLEVDPTMTRCVGCQSEN